MIHFIRPDVFWMLLPALFYLAWVVYSSRPHNPWKKVCDPHLLAALVEYRTFKTNHFLYVLFFLFYVISIIALAGPAWKKVSLPVYRDVSSMMVVLDLSSAMLEVDIKPDRLARAKYKMRDLIHASQNTQMGLVVFTDEAFTVSPLSQDANTLNALLDELTPGIMPVSGSDSGQGLTEGHRLLKQAAVNHENILLITASNPTANSWNAAKAIAEEGGQVNVLAMLANNANNQTILSNLQQLAKTGNGSFYLFTTDASDVQGIIKSQGSAQHLNAENTQQAYQWQDAGPWFCLLLIPIALFVLREKMRHETR